MPTKYHRLQYLKCLSLKIHEIVLKNTKLSCDSDRLYKNLSNCIKPEVKRKYVVNPEKTHFGVLVVLKCIPDIFEVFRKPEVPKSNRKLIKK